MLKKLIKNLLKKENIMPKKHHKNKRILILDPKKMFIKKNDLGDYSILAHTNEVIVEVGRYKDPNDDYLVSRVHEILEYIQD